MKASTINNGQAKSRKALAKSREALA